MPRKSTSGWRPCWSRYDIPFFWGGNQFINNISSYSNQVLQRIIIEIAYLSLTPEDRWDRADMTESLDYPLWGGLSSVGDPNSSVRFELKLICLLRVRVVKRGVFSSFGFAHLTPSEHECSVWCAGT
jgi:hypothetical protein